LKKILNKYGGNFPDKWFSGNDFNNLIQEICRDAGLTEKIRITVSTGGKIKTVTKPLYELVTAHTARRTYATVMFKLGISPSLIMTVTGHKSQAMLMHYIRMTDNDKSDMMAKEIERLNL